MLSTCELNLSLTMVYNLQIGKRLSLLTWCGKATTDANLTETLVAAGAKLLPRERRAEHLSPQLCYTWCTYNLTRIEINAAC